MARKERAPETPPFSAARTFPLPNFFTITSNTVAPPNLRANPVSLHTWSSNARDAGYAVAGTSPLGTRKNLRFLAERSILSLPKICSNGGGRGFLVEIDPQVLTTLLHGHAVDCSLVE